MKAHNYYWQCKCGALASDTIPTCPACQAKKPDLPPVLVVDNKCTIGQRAFGPGYHAGDCKCSKK